MPDGSSDDSGPSPDEPTLIIEDGVKLCGAIRWSLKNFKKAFATKHQVELQGGVFPAKKIRLRGVIRYGDLEAVFASDELEMDVQSPGEAHALALLNKAPAKVSDGTPIELSLRLTAQQDENYNRFVIDDFSTLDRATEYKSIKASTDGSLDVLSRYRGAVWGPCRIEGVDSEIFRFTFANGDEVEFETRTQMLDYDKTNQRGVVLRAKGKVAGISFDVDRWQDLIYATKEFSASPRVPSLGVRFPESKGICGVGFKMDNDDPELPYRAQLLDCDLEVQEELKLKSVKYPTRFIVP